MLVLYQIPNKLKPQLPPLSETDKFDNNYGVKNTWIKIPINIYNNHYRLTNIPRYIWVEKSSTLQEVHYAVFKLIKNMF